jgi:hypothetical protein
VIEAGGGQLARRLEWSGILFMPGFGPSATHRIVEDSTMDTRRFRYQSPFQAFVAFRWLGWVMLMMFVLIQTAHAAVGAQNVV